jgi:hypothetical protein
MWLKESKVTIGRDNQISRIPFPVLRDKSGSVRVNFDDATVKVQRNAKVSGTLE